MNEPPWFADLARGPDDVRPLWLRTGDGLRLRAVLCPHPEPAAAVLVLPGRSEWAEKYGPVARALVGAGFAAAIVDWRGQGLSDRLLPDPLVGHVARFADYQTDLAALRDAVRDAWGALPLMMLGHSMGGCIGLRALLDGRGWDAAAFSAPMWGLPLSARQRVQVRLMAAAARLRGRPGDYVPGRGADYHLAAQGFEGNGLTADRATYDWFRGHVLAHPELMIAGPSIQWLAAALAEMAALARRPSPPVPCRVDLGGRETVVDPAAVRARMARWSGGALALHSEAQHEILMEGGGTGQRALEGAVALFRRVLA